MAGKRKLTVVIAGDAKGLDTATASAGKSLNTFADQTRGFSKVASAGIAAVGVGALAMGKSFVDAAEDSQKVGKQTEAVLKSMGGQAGLTAGDVAKLSTKLSEQSGVDDELIQSGENVLLTFGKVRNEAGKGNDIFNRATQSALDMSVALGTDLSSANIQLGKALNDPIKGITALSKAGVSFSEQEKEQIKTAVAHGDVLTAQKIVLSELDKQFAGSAASQATAGAKLSVTWGNLQEQLGGYLLPAFNGLASAGTKVLGAFQDLPEPVQSVGTKVLAVGAAALAVGGSISFAVGHLKTMRDNLGPLIPNLTNAEGGLTRMGGALAALGVVGAIAGIAQLGASLNKTTFDMDGLTAATARSNSASGEQLQRLIPMLDATGKLDDAVRQLSGSNLEAAGRLVDMAAKAGLSTDKVAALRDIVNAKSTAEAQASVDSKAHADSMEHEAAAAGGLDAQLKEVADTLRAQFDPLFGAQTATQQLAKAQTDAAAAARDHGAGSKEAQAADQAAVQAALNYQGSLINLKAAIEKGDVSLSTATETLRGWVRQGVITQTQADETIQSFGGLKTAADRIPRQVGIDVDANVSAAERKFDTFVRKVNGTGIKFIDTAPSHVDGKRAGGGGVRLGGTYLVGEEGPELFVPSSSGTIVPNSGGMGALRSASNAGVTVYMTVDLNGAVVTEGVQRLASVLAPAVRSELETVLRRNGGTAAFGI